MAQIQVTIDASDAKAVFASLAQASVRSRLLHAVGGIVERQTKRRFNTKISPDGAPWAPWASTHRGQRGRGILIETGRLLGSVTNIVSGDSVAVGSNVMYGRFHQFGTRRMVARPWLGVGRADIAQIEATLVNFLKAIFK